MTKAPRLSICVFIDAFGWELAQRLPFMDAVLTEKSPLETVFGYSSTCDPTILTGLSPREHGHFAFFQYAPGRSPFKGYRLLGLLPKSLMSRGRVRRLLSRIVQRLHGYTGYFQLYNMPFRHLHLFDYSEKRNLYREGGIRSGARTVFDLLRAARFPFYLSDWRADEEQNLASCEAAVREGKVVFAYLFLAHLDAVLHEHGTQSEAAAAKVRWYEERLGRLYAAARERYEEVRLFVFSDHGMTDTRETCDLMARVNALGLRFGEDFAAAYDSTMARFWFHNPRARALIEEELSKEPSGRILSQEELAAWGCDFPNHEYGELFFLLNPGILLCPSFMGERPLAAMHGYAPEDAGSTAVFMSSVPVYPRPRTLADLFGLMLREAGLDAPV